MPPATEELYANPQALGGFNEGLRPALSGGEELGLRANVGNRALLDAAIFHLTTRDDFERFRIPDRPPGPGREFFATMQIRIWRFSGQRQNRECERRQPEPPAS